MGFAKDPAGFHPRSVTVTKDGAAMGAPKSFARTVTRCMKAVQPSWCCKVFDGKKVCYCEPGYYGDGCQFSYVKLPSPTKEHNISYDPLVPKVDVVDLDVHNSTLNSTGVKLTGCRAEQFSNIGERVESRFVAVTVSAEFL